MTQYNIYDENHNFVEMIEVEEDSCIEEFLVNEFPADYSAIPTDDDD
jgi:hypothetical protein